MLSRIFKLFVLWPTYAVLLSNCRQISPSQVKVTDPVSLDELDPSKDKVLWLPRPGVTSASDDIMQINGYYWQGFSPQNLVRILFTSQTDPITRQSVSTILETNGSLTSGTRLLGIKSYSNGSIQLSTGDQNNSYVYIGEANVAMEGAYKGGSPDGLWKTYYSDGVSKELNYYKGIVFGSSSMHGVDGSSWTASKFFKNVLGEKQVSYTGDVIFSDKDGHTLNLTNQWDVAGQKVYAVTPDGSQYLDEMEFKSVNGLALVSDPPVSTTSQWYDVTYPCGAPTPTSAVCFPESSPSDGTAAAATADDAAVNGSSNDSATPASAPSSDGEDAR